MKRADSFGKAMVVALLTLAFMSVVYNQPVLAQEPAAAAGAAVPSSVVHLLGVALGLGMIVIGAGLGIGKLAAAAAEGIARQPEAADRITGAVNLPLFLLEGVAILAEVFALLVLLLANPFNV
jgi:F-type H+-transporting ATPase subunit c